MDDRLDHQADAAPGQTERIPDGVEELNRRVESFVEALRGSRDSLDSDALAALASPRARLEVGLDSVDAFIFTIDGVLQGSKVTGALLAGEVMLIRAKSGREAQELANAGLRETVSLLHQEYLTRGARKESPTIIVETGGRRGRPSAGEPLKTLPELRDMLRKAFEPKAPG